MTPDVTARPEKPADEAGVRRVNEQAFAQPDEAAIVDRVRADADPILSLVAESHSEIVGHALFSPVTIDSSPAELAACGMGPVAVLPTHQRRGIGQLLVREGIGRCRDLGWQAIFVLGDPAYYARFGFCLAAPRELRFVSPQFDPAFQLLELVPGALAEARGLVHYHPAFSEQ